MGMFCYQCQETAKGSGCTVAGVCGKSAEVAQIQDMLIYTVRGISDIVVKGKLDVSKLEDINEMMYNSLFMTITNANFDGEALKKQIYANIKVRNELVKQLSSETIASLHDAATFAIANDEELMAKAQIIGVLSTENEDVRSLRELITYGMKGYAAYGHHALNLGKEAVEQYEFMYEAMAGTIDNSLNAEQLTALALKTGEVGVKVMALLDEANTTTYGNPEMTKVNIGVRNNPAILISGHDLKDLERLLDQTQGTGVDVYTHSEMLPGNSYPKFKKYENLVGNYGNAWWEQRKEFKSFNGPILFTTNCIVPPTDPEIKDRIFTTGSSGFPGTMHIEADENGNKDFSKIIEMAKTLPAPTEIESGSIIAGFAHHQVFQVADKVVEAVKAGDIKHFVVMAGCDGRMKSRSYYTDFAKKLPKDTVILTSGCAKYRFNKLDLGDINGIPRVLDAGQCNDSYSLVLIALKLQEAFGLESVNDLPLAFNISWYEQKAVIVLLALLSLNVKNIHLGPTLPAFLSPNVVNVLVENFGIAGISTVEDDMKIFGIAE